MMNKARKVVSKAMRDNAEMKLSMFRIVQMECFD